MQKQEKPEQPKKQDSDKEYVPAKTFEKAKVAGDKEYFWAGSVYTMTNKRRETVYGVVDAQNAKDALELITSRYSVERLYRHFELATLNKV